MPLKTKRKQDKNLLESIREQRCSVCNAAPPNDASHIKTRGSGGPDEIWNVVPHCRICHIEWGKIGFSRFFEKHPNFKLKLKLLGWDWSSGKLLHYAYDELKLSTER